jgi:predicted nucleic acid-binding Zn ribbon protein
VERLLTPPAIQFKGGGWYVTDYARKSAPSSDKSERAGSKEPAETAGAKESKPAPKQKTAQEK